MRWTRVALGAYVVVFFAAVYTPIAVLIGLSFNANRTVYIWTGFTTDWYGVALSSQRYMVAFSNSILTALGTTALSIVLGTLAGIGLARITPGRMGFMWDALVLLPLIIPEIIEAFSISKLYRFLGVSPGIPATILGHTVFSVSFVALIVRARMGDVGKSYEEASKMLGANRVRTFFSVVLPLAAPAIVAGAFLSFAASFDDVVKSKYTMGKDLLPLVVFAEAARGGITPSLDAIATIMVIISLSAAFLRIFSETRVSRA